MTQAYLWPLNVILTVAFENQGIPGIISYTVQSNSNTMKGVIEWLGGPDIIKWHPK